MDYFRTPKISSVIFSLFFITVFKCATCWVFNFFKFFGRNYFDVSISMLLNAYPLCGVWLASPLGLVVLCRGCGEPSLYPLYNQMMPPLSPPPPPRVTRIPYAISHTATSC